MPSLWCFLIPSRYGDDFASPPELDADLRAAADEDHRSVHQTVVHAIETYLALRETAEIKADPAALRALAEARATASWCA